MSYESLDIKINRMSKIKIKQFLFIGSIPSLAAGLAFGSILGFGAYQTTKNPNNLALSLGTSAALGGIMGVRYLNSGKIMPAGLLAALR